MRARTGLGVNAPFSPSAGACATQPMASGARQRGTPNCHREPLRGLARWPIIECMSKQDLRFAAGSRDGPRSSVWRVRFAPNDVYVWVRSGMKFSKISLHADRICLFKTTDEHRQSMEERGQVFRTDSFARWTRPVSLDSGITPALLITMPTDFLRATGDVPEKEIRWLKPAPAGQAVKVGFFFTKDRADGEFPRSGQGGTARL